MLNLFRYGLIPVVLFCIVIVCASIDAQVTNLAQKSSWQQTTITVVESQDPGDIAAQFSGTPNNFPDPHGTVRYVADGKSYTWQGRGRDIGLTEMRPGERINLYYNPANPQEINTLVLLGAGTGFLILAAAAGFLAFYIWYFWLRGFLNRSGPGVSGDGGASSALRRVTGGASFGQRG